MPGCWPTTRMGSASSAAGAARSPPTGADACRCRWARCRRRSAAMAAISARRSAVIELMANRARTLIYSTGLPPGAVAAATRRARHHRDASRELVARPLAKARAFTRVAGLPEAQSAIVPVRARRARRRRSRPRSVARGGGISRRRDPAADRARAARRGCASLSPPPIPTRRWRGSRTMVREHILRGAA